MQKPAGLRSADMVQKSNACPQQCNFSERHVIQMKQVPLATYSPWQPSAEKELGSRLSFHYPQVQGQSTTTNKFPSIFKALITYYVFLILFIREI